MFRFLSILFFLFYLIIPIQNSGAKTKFVKAYNRYGIPNPFKIKGKLLKDYDNQVIVFEE